MSELGFHGLNDDRDVAAGVIPAKAGIHDLSLLLDACSPRLRGQVPQA